MLNVKKHDESPHPATGVHQDITNFMKEFSDLSSFQFKDFSKLWKKWRFDEISYGRYTENALKDFMQCLFHQLVNCSQCVHSRSTQVCSIYLMYAFFIKQPQHLQLFLRVTMTEFDVLMALCDFLCKEKHLDCLFIMKRLFESNAFRMCATLQPYYPGVPKFTCSEDLIGSLNTIDGANFNKTQASHVIDHENVQKLSEVHKLYQKMKADISSDQSGEIPHSLKVVHEDTVKKLQKLVTDPVEKPVDVSIPLSVPGPTSVNEDERDRGQAYADHRHKLKSSAFDTTQKINWRVKHSAMKRSYSSSDSDNG